VGEIGGIGVLGRQNEIIKKKDKKPRQTFKRFDTNSYISNYNKSGC